MLNLAFSQEYSSRSILIAVKDDRAEQMYGQAAASSAQSNTGLARLFKKYEVTRMDKWLKSADAGDVYNGIDFSKIYRVVFSKDQPATQLQTILSEFRNEDEVTSARPEPRMRIATPLDAYSPDDPYFDQQWYLEKIMADYAWAFWGKRTPGDSTIRIGVVDTGVDYMHPDLAEALYINPGEDLNDDHRFTDADLNGADDDGNGFVDDVRGWDFTAGKMEDQDWSGDNDIRPPSAGSYQILSHGSHVSGILGATGNNNIGIAGVTFQSKIIATKQSFDDDLDNGWLWAAYDGVLYCAKMGARVINCSWGGGYSDQYDEQLINMVSNKYGAIVVCAAGNDNNNNDNNHFYPSDYDSVVTVAALAGSDQKAYFSNYGKVIEISAPGVGIYSTIHYYAGAYRSWQGTSMASPVVAGSLALLMAWFPGQPRQWYVDELLNGADNIDERNPGYEGLLGAGRVNLYTPIARRIFPDLQMLASEFSLAQDNGDSRITPGDRVSLLLTLQNSAGWQDARDISLTLSCQSHGVSVIDSVVNIEQIAAGEFADHASHLFQFDIADTARIQPLRFSVSIRANPDSQLVYREIKKLELTMNADEPGFPRNECEFNLPLSVDELVPGLGNQIIAVGADNKLYVFEATGKLRQGFPVDLESFISMPPVIGDINGDNWKEIILITRRGVLFVVDAAGQIITRKDFGEAVYGSAALANFDQDHSLEIVFGTMTRKLYIVNADGSVRDGYPLSFSAPLHQGVALADFSGDSIPEILFGAADAKLHLVYADGTEAEGWPIKLDSRLEQNLMIIKDDQTLRIITCLLSNGVKIYDETGAVIGEYKHEHQVSAAPALCDWNKDGQADIFFVTGDKRMHGVEPNGKPLDGFPLTFSEGIRTSPLFGDFNADGHTEIICSGEQGQLYVLNGQDDNYVNFPASLGQHLNASPALADLDGDNQIELITGGSDGLHVIEARGQNEHGRIFWSNWLGNNLRDGCYDSDIATELPSVVPLPHSTELRQNYPNPFNPETTIFYTVGTNSSAPLPVELSIYDVLGRKLVSLVTEVKSAGSYSVQWDATAWASGLYYYRLNCGGITQTRKMLLVR
jgi:subtilisin family serine protease